MPPKIARLAALGAFGACAAFVALYVYVAWLSSPTKTGGILMSTSVIVYISIAVVVLALIAAHVAIGRQLMHIGNGEEPRPV